MENLKLYFVELLGLFPFLVCWQGLIVGFNLALDFSQQGQHFSWKKNYLINFFFSLAAMLTIVLGYYVVAWSPLFPKESVLAVAVLAIISSASLYRFKVFKTARS
jgi:hypothetical protein